MSRFKFRVWSGRNEKMYLNPYVELYSDGSFGFGTSPANADWIPNHEDDVLMQYPGLKDKNGKEMCEGDICTYYNDYLGRRLKVKIEVSQFVFTYTHLDTLCKIILGTRILQTEIDLEIIGDIYDKKYEFV